MISFIITLQLIAAFIAAMSALKGNTQLLYSSSWWAMVLAMLASILYLLNGELLFGFIYIVYVFLWKLVYKKAKKDLYGTD